MTTTHPEPTWPNQWTDHDEDEPLTGFDIKPDLNGLQISMARYLNYLREQQAKTEEQVAA